ncbi:GIY-YIG nuclease family protein [Bacillus cereus]|uniref:GIY-YIG nuclease family protein n=1 Tax=Bacillus cereus TaxID=1396 RepID=UPI003D65CDD3
MIIREYKCREVKDLYATELIRLRENFELPGVYILKDKGDKIIYIGMTKKGKSLSTRVQQHINGQVPATFDCRKYIYKVELFVFDDSNENLNRIGSLEHDLIASYDPPCNMQYTTRKGDDELVKAEVQNYLKLVNPKYHRDNWTPYEKFAFIKGISIPDSVMIAAAQFELDTDLSLLEATLNTGDWKVRLKELFVSMLANSGLDENQLISTAWDVVQKYHVDEEQHGKAMQKLLSRSNEYRNRLEIITKSEVVNKGDSYDLNKPSRELDIEVPENIKEEEDCQQEKEFDVRFQHLLKSGKYYKFDISSNQEIAKVGKSTLEYLEINIKDRYIPPYKDKHGEKLLACLSVGEIMEIADIMNNEDKGLVATDFDYEF